MTRILALLLIALATVPASRADAAPLAVAAVELGDHAVVAWSPGAAPADAYRVYGVTSARTLALLAEVPGSEAAAAAVVPGGFPAYAVSAVVGGVEGEATRSTGACVWYSTTPPAVDVNTSCLPEVPERIRGIVRP